MPVVAVDDFASASSGLIAPYGHAAVLTKSDTDELVKASRALYIGGTGNINVVTVGDADVVFVALKAYSLPMLAPILGRALGPDATVIPAQNGIPWWYFQSHPGELSGTTLESVDPGGAIAALLGSIASLPVCAPCSLPVLPLLDLFRSWRGPCGFPHAALIRRPWPRALR